MKNFTYFILGFVLIATLMVSCDTAFAAYPGECTAVTETCILTNPSYRTDSIYYRVTIKADGYLDSQYNGTGGISQGHGKCTIVSRWYENGQWYSTPAATPSSVLTNFEGKMLTNPDAADFYIWHEWNTVPVLPDGCGPPPCAPTYEEKQASCEAIGADWYFSPWEWAQSGIQEWNPETCTGGFCYRTCRADDKLAAQNICESQGLYLHNYTCWSPKPGEPEINYDCLGTPPTCPDDSQDKCDQKCLGWVDEWNCVDTENGYDETCKCLPACAHNYHRDPRTGECVPDEDEPPKPCEPPLVRDELGNCVNPEDPDPCSPGYHEDENGVCQPDDPDNPPCAPGFVLYLGQCLADPNNPPEPCAEGEERDDKGYCIPEEPPIECPEGQSLDGDECVDDNDPCPSGFKTDPDNPGECIPVSCPEGTHYSDGICVPGADTPVSEYKKRWEEFQIAIKELPLFAALDVGHVPAGRSSLTIDAGELGGQHTLDFAQYDFAWTVFSAVILLMCSFIGIRILTLKR